MQPETERIKNRTNDLLKRYSPANLRGGSPNGGRVSLRPERLGIRNR